MRRPHEERTEVPRVVGIGHGNRRRGPDLSHERPQTCHQTDEIVWCECQYRVLSRVLRQRRVAGRVTSDLLGRVLVQRHADAAIVIEADGVGVENVNGVASAPHFTHRTAS